MISPVTGEVFFSDGLRFSAQEALSEKHICDARAHALLPIPGWTRHVLGVHPADRGDFEIEAISDRDSRIQVVLLSHAHAFYELGTPSDSERRAFHEGILNLELFGQREYSWGEAFCRLEPQANRDWLVIVYALGGGIPLHAGVLLSQLYEHEPAPRHA
jgi:hypothetical protein